ncbi:MAG: phosphoglycerate dehydrogenase [Chloroflexota bacterium]|nr:phosphoglycerate dehydrogenase [Chloroflexota bacterium]
MPHALILTPVFTTRDETPLTKLRDAGWTVRHVPGGTHATEDELIDLLAEGVDATIAGGEPYTRRVLEASPRLKHVARWGVGFDRVDIPAATELGVLVTTTQGANDWGVADHAVAMMLGLGHLLVENDREVRSGTWGRRVGTDLWRKTVGIVGLGRIGKGVAQRVSGFETRILAFEPYTVDQEFCGKYGVRCVSLEELLRESDYVTLHLPASAETRHFMNAERFALMKPTAYIVNTARGSLIDEDALYVALTGGRLAGAGLDVRESEPPKDSRFNDLPNVILTSHIAGVTHETVAAMAHMAVDSVLAATKGGRPAGLLNPETWERRRR